MYHSHKKLVHYFVTIALCNSAVSASDAPWRPAQINAAPYDIWAHCHWVWLSAFDSNQANVTAYVADYAAHNVTVGTTMVFVLSTSHDTMRCVRRRH
jgi:hypothetical protein